MGDKKIIIVGVCGATNSGKTQLTKSLLKKFPHSHIICQDDYFYPVDSDKLQIIPELNHVNWEILESIDMEKMLMDVKKWCHEERSKDKADKIAILFLDGFIIFNYRPMAQLCHRKYFLTVNKEVCRQRRNSRVYEPPDCPGYFDKIVWPFYLKNKEEIQDQTDIVYLDGTEDPEALFQTVCHDTENLLKSIQQENVKVW